MKTLGNNVSLNIEYNNRYQNEAKDGGSLAGLTSPKGCEQGCEQQIKKHDWKLNGNTIKGFDYGHDSVGNRLYSENLVTANKSEHFAFDNADRLTSFKTGTLNGAKDNIIAPTYSQSWDLDKIGNWEGFTDNGTSSTNTFSDTHEMTVFKGITNTFDNNGNLIFDGIRTFKYDAFNRIIEVKVSSVVLAEYSYDAFNRRVMKKVDADLNSSFETTVKFLYDGFRCIEELDGSNALVKEFVYGSLYIDEVILQRSGATDYYFTHDYRYSVTSVTDLSGSIIESYDYKVYGQRTASGSGLTDVGYTGQRHDAETGLMYFKNRYYSTSMGSFVTRDPLGYVDGLSMYLGYFGGQKRDPLGLVVILIHGVNTDAKWFSSAESGLKTYWKKSGLKEQAIIEFSWGDECAKLGFGRIQGGYPNYATDSVEGIKSTTPNRDYMVEASKRMRYILNKLNSAKTSSSSAEPIDVIAHSQGTILTLAALHEGAKLDNFIMQGSPLDVWNKSNTTESKRKKNGLIFKKAIKSLYFVETKAIIRYSSSAY